MTPRCIATPTHHTRCHREAFYHDGTYTCPEHRLSRALLDVDQTESVRRMLALIQEWETLDEGQDLIDAYTGQNRRVA